MELNIEEKEMLSKLKAWMEENGEDVILDGPIILSEDQQWDLCERMKANTKIARGFEKEGYALYEIDYDKLSVSEDSKLCKRVLKEFAKYLVAEKITF